MDTREDTEVVDLQGDVTWTETLHSVIFGHLRVTFKKQSTLSDLYWTKRKKEKKKPNPHYLPISFKKGLQTD